MKKFKAQIKEWLLENCIDEYGDLNLTELDFSDFEGNIYINKWKAKKNLYQDKQIVEGDLFQNNQIVGGNLHQYKQNVKGKLWQDNQKEELDNENKKRN